MDYYSMSGTNDPELSVVSADQEFTYDYLDSLVKPADWNPVSLSTRPGKLVDFPPNNMVGWGTLCSERMKDVLDVYSELFVWLRVFVSYAGDQFHYYVLHAIAYPDVLDECKTIRNKATGSVIKPVFSAEKIGSMHMFMPFKGGVNPICSDLVKNVLEKEGITGIEFVKRPVS